MKRKRIVSYRQPLHVCATRDGTELTAQYDLVQMTALAMVHVHKMVHVSAIATGEVTIAHLPGAQMPATTEGLASEALVACVM